MDEIFTIPNLKGKSLNELRVIGKSLNASRAEVLEQYKVGGKVVQDAIERQEKIEIAERKLNDPDYDEKHQTIGR